MSFDNFESQKKNGSESPADPSRRKFLKTLSAGAAYVAANNIPGIKEFAEESVSREDIAREAVLLKEGLERRYGISIDFSAVDDEVESGSALSPIEQRDTLRELDQSLSMYPKGYVGNTRLKNIHVVNNYTRMMNPFIDGITHERRNPHPGRMLLNREHLLTKLTLEEFFSPSLPRTFHHEFYHLSDEHDEYHEASQGRKSEFNDRWAEEHKRLGGAGYSLSAPFTSKGFPSGYAMTSPTEQRAVIAEFLMSDYVGLMDMAKDDPALANSIGKIKSEFLEKSDGVMDETYWKLVQSGESDAIRKYVAAKETLAAC